MIGLGTLVAHLSLLNRLLGLRLGKWRPVPSRGRYVTWSDTDTGKVRPAVSRLDPIW